MIKDLKKNKVWFYIFAVLIVLILANNIYLLINIAGLYSIENALRLGGSIILVILCLLNIFLIFKALLKGNKVFYVILLIITLLINGGIGFINLNFNFIYNRLNKISVNYTTYSISLVTSSSNEVSSIDGIKDEDIAIINDHEIANGYVFGAQILKEQRMKNTLKEYSSYIEIIDEVLAGNIKYAFLPSNYVEAFSSIDGYKTIGVDLKTIYEQNKQEEQTITKKDITEPFTILLMGVDSTQDNIANTTANGDTLMVITFNPNTLKATMLSVPRDSYVPITCMRNRKNKITHSSWGGEQCMINTVQQFLDIHIDYYAKINFTGIVKLVDSLGGIDVDVEYSFCEQNSKRHIGVDLVYVEKGWQTLNGEQALAYARNRHPNPEFCDKKWTNYNSNDFIRGVHQQDIVKAILTKMKDIRELDTFYNLLDTISSNMETNMDKNTILSFYNVAKDIVTKSQVATSIEELINIQRLYISGTGAMVYDYNQNNDGGSRLTLYEFVPSQDSVNAVKKAMKINLGQANKDVIYNFSYDIHKPYEEVVIGKGIYSNAIINMLPDFVGKNKSEVEQYAKEHNLNCVFIEEENDAPAGTIIAQDPPVKMDLDNMNPNKGLTITISVGKNSTSNSKYNVCSSEENKDNPVCQLDIATYIGRNYTAIKSLKISSSIATINYTPITEGATKSNTGNIISLNDETTGTINLTSVDQIEVKYYSYNNTGESNIGDENTSGDSNNTGDENTSGDSGNTGNENTSGDSGNTGNENTSGDSGNTGNENTSGDSGNTGNENTSGDSSNTGNEDTSGDSGNTGDENNNNE